MARCKNIVLTGANRGIGLELAKQLLSKFNPDNLFATYRDPEASKELLELATQNPNLHPVVLDIRDTEKYEDIVATVEDATQGTGINLLINNAGAYLKNQNTLPDLDKDGLMFHFEVNTVSPIMITKAFLPLLEKASSQAGSTPPGINKAVVLHISTNFGSISDNSSGGAYGYRASKAALNQAAKNMSIELEDRGILVVPLHPGWVKTDMGGEDALIGADESVSGILSVLEELDESKNGHFMRFDGKEASW